MTFTKQLPAPASTPVLPPYPGAANKVVMRGRLLFLVLWSLLSPLIFLITCIVACVYRCVHRLGCKGGTQEATFEDWVLSLIFWIPEMGVGLDGR